MSVNAEGTGESVGVEGASESSLLACVNRINSHEFIIG